MRQSSTLPLPTVCPCTTGLCRLLSAPAGRRTFPTLSLRIFPYVLGPLPRRLVWCIYPFLPTRQRPSPRSDRVGAPLCAVQRLPYGALFRGCSHSLMFRPIGLLATQIAPTATAIPYGSRDFYVRASRGLLPSHAPDMLTVRIGQLTVWGLAPHQIRSLVGCSALLGAGSGTGLRLDAPPASPHDHPPEHATTPREPPASQDRHAPPDACHSDTTPLAPNTARSPTAASMSLHTFSQHWCVAAVGGNGFVGRRSKPLPW
jgi:hypothetical protein